MSIGESRAACCASGARGALVLAVERIGQAVSVEIRSAGAEPRRASSPGIARA